MRIYFNIMIFFYIMVSIFLHLIIPPIELVSARLITGIVTNNIISQGLPITGRCRLLGTKVERVGITMANLSLLKTGKVKAVRFSTLEALCRELDCKPGDLLEYDSL